MTRAVHYAHSTWGETLCERDLFSHKTTETSQFSARVTCSLCRERLAKRARLDRLADYLASRSPEELAADR